MPWLMMHITRPAILLASMFLGALVVSLLRMRRERMEAAGLLDTTENYNESSRTSPPRLGRRYVLRGRARFCETARHRATPISL